MVEQMFNLADANRDGVLVEDEFKQFSGFLWEAVQGLKLSNENTLLVSLFNQFEENKDTYLKLDEIMKSLDNLIKDLNHKRFNWRASPDITADEFRKMVKQMFNAADDNRDGVLQLDEFK